MKSLEFQFWRGHQVHEIWVLPTIGFDRKRRDSYPWCEIILLVGRSSFGLRVYLCPAMMDTGTAAKIEAQDK